MSLYKGEMRSEGSRMMGKRWHMALPPGGEKFSEMNFFLTESERADRKKVASFVDMCNFFARTSLLQFTVGPPCLLFFRRVGNARWRVTR